LHDVSLVLKRGIIGENSRHTLGVSAIKGVSVGRLEFSEQSKKPLRGKAKVAGSALFAQWPKREYK
jgi:hypothetical protein